MNLSTNNISIYRFFTNLFFVLIIGFSNLFFSQELPLRPNKASAIKSTLLPEIAAVSEDIVYKINKKGKPLALDLYTPNNATTEMLPVLI